MTAAVQQKSCVRNKKGSAALEEKQCEKLEDCEQSYMSKDITGFEAWNFENIKGFCGRAVCMLQKKGFNDEKGGSVM